MESDATTGTESDFSDWDPAVAALTTENSEDSDEYGIYYGDMYDTPIGGQTGYGGGRHYISPGDSAYSGSGPLYPIHELGSGTNDSSDDEQENSERNIQNSVSLPHSDIPVYGRYQKLKSQEDNDTSVALSEDSMENLMLHRLPGENLGMILGIEDNKDGSGRVACAAVKSVTLGGAAYRASGGSKGLCVGDEILFVNGLDLRTFTHDECVQVFKDMPLRVMLGVQRGQKDLPPVSISPAPCMKTKSPSRKLPKVPVSVSDENKPVQITRRHDASDSEDDGFAGFAVYQVLLEKEPEENLGISIVPSYGSTCEYYQVKRILPSGAAAHSGQLEVGDRLITCNSTSLRALTQNHCLDIIKSASACGDIRFEVIRPVYNGNSMEISVTLNNGVNNSKLRNYPSNFDPSQYSLKSQSYDRQAIDVVVTSESDDYLTVSEDEYSRIGRLANIPESEANEVFVSNSVRLAFQKDINTIEEESSETKPELLQQDLVLKNSERVEIVDLNSFHTSPYHIPHKSNHQSFGIDQVVPDIVQNLNSSIPKTDIDEVSPRSSIPRSDLDQLSPRSPIPRSNLDQLSPRSPVPKSNLDQVSPRSPVPRSNLDQVSPRSPIPRSNVDQISPTSSLPRSGLDSGEYQFSPQSHSNTDYDSSFSQRPNQKSFIDHHSLHEEPSDIENLGITDSYTKRQQIPSSSELDIPYNYPPNFISQEIPVSDTEATRYNPLYEDSNASEFTDSEPQDIYIHSPVLSHREDIIQFDPDRISLSSNRTLTKTDLDSVITGLDQGAEVDENISSSEEISVPPPVEFSDNNTDNIGEWQIKYHQNKFEQEADDIEDIQNYDEELDSAKLAFNSELTAPFDIVLQEQGISLHSEPPYNDCLNKSDEELVNKVSKQFENSESLKVKNKSKIDRDLVDRSGYIVKRFAPSTDMDQNSQYMVQNALDMENETISATQGHDSKIKLGGNEIIDFDDPTYTNNNIVAEHIAKDIIAQENGGVGYFVESDDEPDKFPAADMPEDAPELPDAPPPDLFGDIMDKNGFSVTISVNGDIQRESPVLEDVVEEGKSGFKSQKHGLAETTEDPVVPLKVPRKVNIPVEFVSEEQTLIEDEGIVVESVTRNFQLPEHFQEVVSSPDKSERDNLEELVTVTSKMSPNTSPRSLIKNLNVENSGAIESDLEEVAEEKINPVEIKKDHARNLVNVISVVNALKSKHKDKDPDNVDMIAKEDAKEKPKSFLNTVIRVKGNSPSNHNDNVESSPPRKDEIITSKDQINVKTTLKVESEPPKEETIETNREVIKRPDIPYTPTKEKSPITTKTVPIMKTSITVEKTNTDNKSSETKENLMIPPLNLESLNASNNDAGSPTSDRSGDQSPTSVYKTTIGVPKPLSPKINSVTAPITQNKPVVGSAEKHVDSKVPETVQKERASLAPTPQIRPLSQIKPLSFNPKSLSQTGSRPLQYKTTISTLGMKPASLSRPLAGSQKPDHAIKRMETLPFEVSILKGILGIGIKTTMTPEGHVQITEILPNGPVGREGNIKVGDYIISINNTPMLGLTDAKVQQIMRLLPRGLSKIVACAVKPSELPQGNGETVEKPALAARQSLPHSSTARPKLSPRQSSPLSSPREQAPGTQDKPQAPIPIPRVQSSTGVSNSQPPVPVPRTLNISTSPRSPNLSPRPHKLSPRSPISPSSTLNPERKTETPSMVASSNSPVVQTKPVVAPKPNRPSPKTPESSPVVSPRQQEKLTKTPPQVAPKPKRNTTVIQNAPIETEIFASITSSNRKSPTSKNILPGSVHYDSVQTVDKSGWIPGIVSSADIQKGKNDVVPNTDSQTERTESTDTVSVVDTISDIKDTVNDTFNKDVNISETDNDKLVNESEQIGNNEQDIENVKEEEAAGTKQLDKIEKDLYSKPIDMSLYANHSRKFSTSSAGSSYNEFKECDVEDDLIQEHIEEEQQSAKETADDNYEPDFEEDESKVTSGDEVKTQEPEGLRLLAESIVSQVISSVKESGILTQPAGEKLNTEDEAPPVPLEAPPILGPLSPCSDKPETSAEAVTLEEITDTPEVTDLMMSLSTEDTPEKEIHTISAHENDVEEDFADHLDAPPLPQSPPPVPQTEVPVFKTSLPAEVVDLALYPDSDNEVAEKAGMAVVVDVVNASVTSDLHVSAQTVDVVVDKPNNVVNDLATNDISDSFVPQDKDTVELREADEDEKVEDSGDQTINDVISMYSNLDKAVNKSDKVENNNNKELKLEVDEVAAVCGRNEFVNTDENKNCATELLTNADDVINSDTLEVSEQDYPTSDNLLSDEMINLNETEPVKLNGHLESRITPGACDIPMVDQETREPEGNTSPTIEDKSVPTRSTSRVDEILRQHSETEQRKYSPELNNMIRMMSTSDDEVPEGEGLVMQVTLNKGVTGLGFLIQGGKSTPKGDMPITIKRIFKGGPADGTLKPGDELLAVDGQDMIDMRHTEAWTHLKFLPSGDFHLTIRRYGNDSSDV